MKSGQQPKDPSAVLLGSVKTPKKAAASRRNGAGKKQQTHEKNAPHTKDPAQA